MRLVCSATVGRIFEKGPVGVGDFCALVVGQAGDGGFELLHEAGEVVAGVGDGGEAEGGGVPGEGFVEFGDGDVEAVLDFFLEAADDLAAVLEGVGVLDAELDG